METKTVTGPVATAGAAAPRAAGRRGLRGLGGLRGRPGLTLLAVALGVMMVALDGTIVAVANPAIQEHLNASLAGIQWVTNAYLLALAVTTWPVTALVSITSSLSRRLAARRPPLSAEGAVVS